MRRFGWMAAVLGLSLAGAAHAQQRDVEQGPKEPRVQSELPTDVPALKRQLATDQKQTAERVSALEAQGVELSSLGEEEIKEIQRNLKQAGYYEGAIDGIPGGATKQAVSRFYRDQAQLASRGVIAPDAGTDMGLQAIQIEAVEVEPVSGEECPDDAQEAQPPEQQPPPEQPTQPAPGQREPGEFDDVHAPPPTAPY